MKIKDEQLLVMMAFRYALGRKTYVVSNIVDLILDSWDEFSRQRQDQLKREILEHEELYGNLGHECDKKCWYKIVNK